MSTAFIPTTNTTITKKTDLLGLTLPELQGWLVERGEAPFRARQIYQWLFQRLVTDFSAMTNLALSLREKLARMAGIAWSAMVCGVQPSER